MIRIMEKILSHLIAIALFSALASLAVILGVAASLFIKWSVS